MLLSLTLIVVFIIVCVAIIPMIIGVVIIVVFAIANVTVINIGTTAITVCITIIRHYTDYCHVDYCYNVSDY